MCFSSHFEADKWSAFLRMLFFSVGTLPLVWLLPHPLVRVRTACSRGVVRKRKQSIELNCSVGKRCRGRNVKTKTAGYGRKKVIQVLG